MCDRGTRGSSVWRNCTNCAAHGRGSAESYCILVGDLKTPRRASGCECMEETTDGFHRRRGPAAARARRNYWGKSQSGLPPFRFADLATDLALVERAVMIAARKCRGAGVHHCGFAERPLVG
jgi:ATP-dependent DNA helicase RecG